MVSSSRLLLAGYILIFAGAIVAGLGVFEQRTTHCDPGQEVVITQLQPNETVAARERAVENLSTAQQAAFREQLPVDGTEQLEKRALSDDNLNTVLAYDGQRYHIYPVEVDDCPPIGRSDQIRGGLTAAVGALIVLAVLGRRRLR